MLTYDVRLDPAAGGAEALFASPREKESTVRQLIVAIIAFGLASATASAASKEDVRQLIAFIKGKHTPKGVTRGSENKKSPLPFIKFDHRGYTYKILIDADDGIEVRRREPGATRMEASHRCSIPHIGYYHNEQEVCDDGIAAALRFFRQKHK